MSDYHELYRQEPTPPRPRAVQVEWAYLLFPQVQERQLVDTVKRHVAQLSHEKGADAANDYCKYLRTMCGFPADFATQCGLSEAEGKLK